MDSDIVIFESLGLGEDVKMRAFKKVPNVIAFVLNGEDRALLCNRIRSKLTVQKFFQPMRTPQRWRPSRDYF